MRIVLLLEKKLVPIDPYHIGCFHDRVDFLCHHNILSIHTPVSKKHSGSALTLATAFLQLPCPKADPPSD